MAEMEPERATEEGSSLREIKLPKLSVSLLSQGSVEGLFMLACKRKEYYQWKSKNPKDKKECISMET